MSKNIRTVRLDNKQIKKIEDFLNKNPYLDFSSLTRMALDHFVQNPTIRIIPVSEGKKASQKERGI